MMTTKVITAATIFNLLREVLGFGPVVYSWLLDLLKGFLMRIIHLLI
jgi:hypothetical protein